MKRLLIIFLPLLALVFVSCGQKEIEKQNLVHLSIQAPSTSARTVTVSDYNLTSIFNQIDTWKWTVENENGEKIIEKDQWRELEVILSNGTYNVTVTGSTSYDNRDIELEGKAKLSVPLRGKNASISVGFKKSSQGSFELTVGIWSNKHIGNSPTVEPSLESINGTNSDSGDYGLDIEKTTFKYEEDDEDKDALPGIIIRGYNIPSDFYRLNLKIDGYNVILGDPIIEILDGMNSTGKIVAIVGERDGNDSSDYPDYPDYPNDSDENNGDDSADYPVYPDDSDENHGDNQGGGR